MGTANFVSGKPLMVKYTPSVAYLAGDVIAVGNLALVAHEDNPPFGTAVILDALSVRGGIYQMTVNGAITIGTYVHFDTSTKKISPTPTATTLPFGWLIGGPSLTLDGAAPTTNGDLCLVQHDPIWGSFSGLIQESAADALTAHAGGTQAAALALAAEINRITVVATAGDSVKLPASAPGYDVVVINSAAIPCQVFGAGTDTINDVATATGISQMPNSICLYCCSVAGKWYCEGTGSGYSGSFPTASFTNGITAFATGGQTNAVALTTVYNRVTTVATAGDSVKLPASAPGMQVTVTNAAASNTCNVFPATGDAINSLGANNASPLVAGQTVTYVCDLAGTWNTPLLLPREVSTALTTVGAGTLLAAAIVGGVCNRTGSTAAFTDTTDTAALILAALHGGGVNQSFEFTYYNNTLGTATLTGGTGVTITQATLVPPSCWARYLVTITGAATVTMVGIAMGPNAALPPGQFATTAAGNGTLTAGQIEGAAQCTLASSGATAFTTRTAAQMLAQIPNGQIGMTWLIRVFNTNGGTLTLTGGTGVTITGTATIATNVFRDYLATITGAAAITLQNIGAGNAT